MADRSASQKTPRFLMTCERHSAPRHTKIALAYTLAVGLAGAVPRGAWPQPARRAASAGQLAAAVTIYRDAWGTPHVFGRTDASTVFGFAYAQAEDNFPQLEEDFVLSIGRGAELYGPDLLSDDRLNRTIRVEQLAHADYEALDPHLRALCDAFAAGVRYYLERHPDVHPRLLSRIEPWYPLAFIRYTYYQNGLLRDPKLGKLTVQTADGGRFEPAHNGSNGWVIGPSRSATGHAMLFLDPHLGYFGPGQVYEGHIHSDEGSGWEFSGYTRFGFPFPYIGHNAGVGWMGTDNVPDEVDGYIEHFDDPGHPLAYRYGNGHRVATEFHDTIRVKMPAGVEQHVYTSVWTHHGPVVSTAAGVPVAARMAKYDAHGWLAEWYWMTKARSVADLRQALSPLDMLFGNVMAADGEGTIYYVYNGAVPRRDSAFNWSAPVDGSDPRTEWQGYYALDELPHLTNPATGWMQNCNTSPFLLTSGGNPDPSRYPKYMVREGSLPGWNAQNARGLASWRILAATPKWTFDAWTHAAFDTHMSTADSLLPAWLDRVRPSVTPGTRLDSAVALLTAWDHRSTVASVPATIYVVWLVAVGTRMETRDLARLRAAPGLAEALEQKLDSLARTFGSWRVPWGHLARLQRPTGYSHPPFGAPVFSDDAPSLATPGVLSSVGAAFTVDVRPDPPNKRLYGIHGDTYVSVVEFGPKTRARSVMIFGESADPRSPHFMDQAHLIVDGRMKPSWFTLAEVRAHAAAAYHPGGER